MNKRVILALSAVLLIVAGLAPAGHESAPDFSAVPAGAERKAQFIGYFQPVVQQQNALILEERQTLQMLQQKNGKLWWWNKRTLSSLLQKYRIEEFEPTETKSWDALLSKVDTIPASLALAQSAKESGWGTSRFAKEGNNFFGQWCYNPGCGLVPNRRNSGASHEVEKFDSPEMSVERYLLNLNTNRAYKQLRSIRASLRGNNAEVSGEALVAGLGSYSQRGDAYVKEVRSMIRRDDLGQYDQ